MIQRLVIAPHDPAEFLGGTERVVQAMLKARIRRGEEVAVLAGSERFQDEGATESRGEPGLAVHRIIRAKYETGEIFIRPRARAEFDRFLEVLNPAIVEWHHGATLSLDLVRAAVSRGAKTVMFLHDLWTTCPRYFRIPPPGMACPTGADRGNCTPCAQKDLPWPTPNVRDWVNHFTETARAELQAADLRIAPSRSHAQAIQACFPDDPLEIQVVPHGLLDYDLPPPPARTGTAQPGMLKIAHFGNLVPEKGILDLARALGLARHPDRISLHLFGDALAPGIVGEMRALCPAVRVNDHGPYASFRNIFDDVANCDIAVFPSRAPESYGLVVDEALAAGLPVFASDRGAMPERIGGAGVVIEAGRPDLWIHPIERALLDAGWFSQLRAAVLPGRRTIEDAVDEVDRLLQRKGN